MFNQKSSDITSHPTHHISKFRFARTACLAILASISVHVSAKVCDPDSSVAANDQSRKTQPDLNDPCQHGPFVQNMLRQEKWDDLDALAAGERSSKARFPGGGWRLKSTYQALAYPLTSDDSERATDPDWQAHAKRLARWTAAKPDSITARVALAKFYLDYAWVARGPEFVDLVKDDAQKIFDQRVEKAHGILVEAFKLPAKCPEWYELMLETARAQGWDLAEQKGLLQAASSFEPLYYYYYQEHAFALQPRWYGEVGDSEKFADEIATRIGGKQGAMIYFEIALTLNCLGCSEERSRFQLMSWERINQGYAAEVELYGVGSYKLNQFANLALRANDRKLAATLFLEIGNGWVPEVWGSRRTFLEQQQIAFSMPPDLFETLDVAVKNYGKPGGPAYMKQVESDFHARLDSGIKSCTAAARRDDGAFSVFVRIGQKGEVEQAIPWPPTNVSDCLMPKLSTQRFTPPPQPSYWTYVNVGEAKPQPFLYMGSALPDIGR